MVLFQGYVLKKALTVFIICCVIFPVVTGNVESRCKEKLKADGLNVKSINCEDNRQIIRNWSPSKRLNVSATTKEYVRLITTVGLALTAKDYCSESGYRVM